jgi:hypothetical protein
MSTVPFIIDELTIEVWDGASLGTGCMSESDFKTTSERSSCCSVSKTIRINVGDYAFTSSIQDGYGIPAGFYAPIAFIPVFIYICYFRRKMRLRREKRAKLDPTYAAMLKEERKRNHMSFFTVFCCRSCDNDPSLNPNQKEIEMTSQRDRSSLDESPNHASTMGEGDAMFGRDDYPCSSSSSFFEKMRKSPGYSKLVQQEDAVATSGAFKGLNNLLNATESGEGDAMAWHVQYVAGKPLFTHIR